jgi:hypothetical protein
MRIFLNGKAKNNLIIVESRKSPNNWQYLGSDFQGNGSKGHLVTCPKAHWVSISKTVCSGIRLVKGREDTIIE